MIDEITITSLSGRGSLRMATRDNYGYWLDRHINFGTVNGNHQMYAYYNQIGESIVSTSVPSRDISIVGWVVDSGAGTLQSRCDFLDSFISPVEDYMLICKGKKIQFRPDSSIVYFEDEIHDNELVRKFMIQATCAFPLFSDENVTDVPFDLRQNMFYFPTGWGQDEPLIFGVVSKSYNKEIENTGGFQIGIIAKITFTGTVVNPKLRNLTTDGFIGVNRTFYGGERLEICTISGQKSITLYSADGGTENIMKYRDFRTSWDKMQLLPGGNILAIDCDDLEQRGNMDITVSFTPLHLEVR